VSSEFFSLVILIELSLLYPFGGVIVGGLYFTPRSVPSRYQSPDGIPITTLELLPSTPVNKTDVELGSFYGEKGNTLVLYFYKGKESIKKRLNLGSKRYY
jgi:hypothetical protein